VSEAGAFVELVLLYIHTWHLKHSDYRNTLLYSHGTWHTLPTTECRLGSLALIVSEAGAFVELVLLYIQICMYTYTNYRI
jgi:hypothetical protein